MRRQKRKLLGELNRCAIITLDNCCFKACDAMTHVLQGDLVVLQGTLCCLPGNTLQMEDPIGQNQHGSTFSFKRTNGSSKPLAWISKTSNRSDNVSIVRCKAATTVSMLSNRSSTNGISAYPLGPLQPICSITPIY